MEDLLVECCKLILNELERLLAEGKITKEEYEKHTILKRKLLIKAPI